MNLLAHALLSRNETDQVMTINVLWDFLGKDLRQDQRKFVRRGATIHRTIDRETDTSAEFRQALNLVSEKRESVSGVVVDIALDYALSKDWTHYCTDDRLELFQRFYDRMERAAPSISDRAVTFVHGMRERNWFKSYGELEGIQCVFKRLAHRYRFLDSIIGAEAEIEQRVDRYTDLMRDLFPKVELAVAKL